MAILNFTEKRLLESYLGMGSGYVLNFSNRTFQTFVCDSTGLDIDDDRIGGDGSKANRLRHFWNTQPDHVVGKLLTSLVEYKDGERDRQALTGYAEFHVARETEAGLREKCLAIANRLLQSAPVPDAEVISTLSRRDDFEQIAKGVLDSIHKNDPQGGLDRLHTFTVRFTRSLCETHGITVERDKPLHSVFGEYVKKLKADGLIESRMTETILKSSISVLDAFNDVRNNKSLAHDNAVLNANESLLVFQHVTSAIRFVWALEQSVAKANAATAADAGDIPF